MARSGWHATKTDFQLAGRSLSMLTDKVSFSIPALLWVLLGAPFAIAFAGYMPALPCGS
jgi:hypothetical protein